jgi:hypothetical protein
VNRRNIFLDFPNCGKKSFSNKKSAENKLLAIQKDHKEKKKPVRVYRCEKCRQWHLTSKPIKVEKAKPLEKYNEGWQKLFNNEQATN